MIRIDIDVDIDDAVDMLNRMDRRAKDFRPVFGWARRELQKANRENFTANGLPTGGWNPRTRDYAWPLLRKSGKLFRSLSSLRGSPNEVSRTFAVFGTNVEYAKFHQSGTRDMPKRQIVFSPPGFAKELGREAARHIVSLRERVLP